MSDYSHNFDGGMAWEVAAKALEKMDDRDQPIMITNMLPPPPPLRRQRVRFFPASTVIDSLGSRTNPIDI